MACPDCFSGTIHLGNPTGTVETIHSLPTYVASPPDGIVPKGIVVYIPDAFGWDFVNNRILADHYAKRGNFLVYVPDFMGGSSMPVIAMALLAKIQKPASWFETLFYKPAHILHALSIALPWLVKVRASVTKPRIISFFQALRTSPPPFPTDDLKIGAAGFCWGGKWTIMLAADSPSSRVNRHASQKSTALLPLIDCAFTAHPSMVNVPGDIQAVSIPLSIAIGEDDMAMKAPLIQQTKNILELEKEGENEVVIMPGAKHGFAQRTATEDPLQMKCAEDAEIQAIAWFNKWFA